MLVRQSQAAFQRLIFDEEAALGEMFKVELKTHLNRFMVLVRFAGKGEITPAEMKMVTPLLTKRIYVGSQVLDMGSSGRISKVTKIADSNSNQTHNTQHTRIYVIYVHRATHGDTYAQNSLEQKNFHFQFQNTERL